jgi:hypothetical protein
MGELSTLCYNDAEMVQSLDFEWVLCQSAAYGLTSMNQSRAIPADRQAFLLSNPVGGFSRFRLASVAHVSRSLLRRIREMFRFATEDGGCFSIATVAVNE